jgi:cysteine desulfurase
MALMDLLNFDHNATTPVLPEAWEAMRPYLAAGNAASSHRLGRAARVALEEARGAIAQLLDARPDEVLFTSGATEANNLAIFGLVGDPPGAVVSSAIEHPSVTEPVEQLRRHGYQIVSLPVSREGILQPPSQGWPSDTCLACLMLANHETGAVQPVQELTAQLGPGVAVHCDAAAAAGKVPISFARLGVASLTVSAHKFAGPPGIGALLVRNGVKLRPQIFGGHQQHGKRPGTEPVALAVGMAVALRRALERLEEDRAVLLRYRRRLLEMLRDEAAPVVLNGPEEGLPHTVNVSFPGCQADALLMNLDLAGVACATGSACSSGSLLPSPAIRALGVPDDVLRSALRLSLSARTPATELEEGARRIIKVVNKLRGRAPARPHPAG